MSVLAVFVYRGSSPRGVDAPRDQFSGHRAIHVLQRLLDNQEAHPAGSLENDVVRERLLTELHQLGLETEVHETSTEIHSGRITLKNVLARFPNSAETGTPLLLVSHYDSCPFGPGAGDDGSAVAALLECARILRTEQLERPVYLLFTDGEELGLLGARQFVAKHPLIQQQPFILNFDARGTQGGSLLYETSNGNEKLIAWLASRLPRPCATGSAFVTVYRRMPNGSDFTVFQRAGLPGLNFAFIGGVQRYHTPLDNIEHLDPRSVQHHGENALALARALAVAELPKFHGERDVVFFDLFGQAIVWYPEWVARLLAAIACGALAFALPFPWRRRAYWLDCGRATVVVVLAMGGAFLAGWILKGPAKLALVPNAAATWWMISSLTVLWLVVISLLWAIGRWALARASFDSVWRAVWISWGIAGLVAAWQVPGVSYFAAVPALMAAISCLFRQAERRAMFSIIAAGVVLIPGLYLLPIAFRVTAAPILGPIFVLALTPFLPFATGNGRSPLPPTSV